MTPRSVALSSSLEKGGVTVHDATKVVLWPVRLQHDCDSGQATGNAAAVRHYLQRPGARHRRLVRDALLWRDLPVIDEPGRTLPCVRTEIHDLHAEVFERLANRADAPRRGELAQRAQEVASWGQALTT